jgi:hypothetical protein
MCPVAEIVGSIGVGARIEVPRCDMGDDVDGAVVSDDNLGPDVSVQDPQQSVRNPLHLGRNAFLSERWLKESIPERETGVCGIALPDGLLSHLFQVAGVVCNKFIDCQYFAIRKDIGRCLSTP